MMRIHTTQVKQRSWTTTSAPRTIGRFGWTGVLVLLLTVTASIAQIVPMTSGSPWFNSPSRRSPFDRFTKPTVAVLPVHHHRPHGAKEPTTETGEPC